MGIISKLFGGSDDEEDEQTGEENLRDDSKKPSVGKYHKDLIAPAGINLERPDSAKIGEHFVRTFFINGWPDEPQDGFLREVMHGVNIKNDISIHISPYDSEMARKSLKGDVQKAQKYTNEEGGGMLSSMSKQEDFQETVQVYQALKNTNTKLFDVSMYITIRGESERELDESTETLVKKLRSSPALTKPINSRHQQLESFQSTAPTLEDKINYKTEMMGGAVGAMYPFSSTKIIEPGGIEYGMHAGNSSPVIVNRFDERETGYNQLTFGQIGSGKSFGTKLDILRTYINRDDTKIIMLDPVGGFDTVNDALNGKKVIVGGNLGLNPLEINETPDKIMEKDPEFDPYALQKDKVMDFFEMFFNQRGVQLGDARGALEEAVELAYKNKGIRRDPETHHKESPTIPDVITIIEDMTENPEQFSEVQSATGIHERNIEEDASRILRHFSPFREGGQFENLTQSTSPKLDFTSGDVFYLDLRQGEGQGKVGMIMHLIMSKVYDHSKHTDKKVFFCIDEAHFLTKDAQSLEFLEQVVRHSRHCFLSINFITQNVDDFFANEAAHQIAQNCSLRKFQRVETGLTEEITRLLDMTPQEANFVRNAQPGDPELGYSEALLGVEDKGYVPCRVMASGFEEAVIVNGTEGWQEEAEQRDQGPNAFSGGGDSGPMDPSEIQNKMKAAQEDVKEAQKAKGEAMEQSTETSKERNRKEFNESVDEGTPKLKAEDDTDDSPSETPTDERTNPDPQPTQERDSEPESDPQPTRNEPEPKSEPDSEPDVSSDDDDDDDDDGRIGDLLS